MVLTFSTSDNPKRAVIAVHGWTGDVSSMEPVAKSLRLPDTKWVIPQAPYVSDKKGFTWFQGNDESGWQYQESMDLLSTTISDLIANGFAHKQIIMLGFSQGACFIMEFMIRQTFSIGGIIPIAGFIRDKEKFKYEATDDTKQTRVLLIHGDKDEIIYPEGSEKAKNLFVELGYTVEYHLLSAGHKIPLKAKPLIENFILSL